MNRDKLAEALNAIYNGADAEAYHDELETVISLVINAPEEAIAAAWADIHDDTDA